MYYRYMYVEDVENMCLEKYYESEYSNLPDIDIIKNIDGEFGISLDDNEFITHFFREHNIERRIIKFHSLPKELFERMMNNKTYGTVDCVYGNIATNHFVYVIPYEDDSIMHNFDDNLNPIIYFKDIDTAHYCDDADVIYSYDRIIELSFDQRMNLFCQYY